MKQILFLFIGVIAFIFAVGFYSKTPLPNADSSAKKQASLKKEVIIGSTKISAEIADDEAERKKGLGGRENLGSGEGMLFVFPEKTSNLVFWMKEMKFAIDIIWIDENKIVKIDKNVQPQPGLGENELKRYYPEKATNLVLEVNAGFADNHNLNPGDEVQIPQAP